MKFRKKPVVIEAEQFLWETGRPVCTTDMFMAYPVKFDAERQVPFVLVPTLEDHNAQYHRADVGDWIITGVKGERYPCKPDIFDQTYECEHGQDPTDYCEPCGRVNGKLPF